MRSIGQNPSEGDLRSMVREADKDGNDSIDFKEFLIMMSQDTEGEIDFDKLESSLKKLLDKKVTIRNIK